MERLDASGPAARFDRAWADPEAPDFQTVLQQVGAEIESSPGPAASAGEIIGGYAEQAAGAASVVVGGMAVGVGAATTPEGVGVVIGDAGAGLVGAGAAAIQDGVRRTAQGWHDLHRPPPATQAPAPPPPGHGPPDPGSAAHHVVSTPAQPAIPSHTGAPPPTHPGGQTVSGTARPSSVPHAVETRRNDGLHDNPDLRTSGPRARRNAAAADPRAASAIPQGGQRAHHLIPLDTIRRHRELFDAAARGGFRTDEPGNVALCPKDEASRASAKERGVKRPVHDNGHPDHNDEVDAAAKRIEEELTREGLRPGTPAYDRRAAELVRQLDDQLRQELPKSSRVTENTAPAGASATEAA